METGVNVSERLTGHNKALANSLWVILHHFGSIADQETGRVRIAKCGRCSACSGCITCRELLDELCNGHPILVPDRIEQSERVILGDVARRGESLVLILV